MNQSRNLEYTDWTTKILSSCFCPFQVFQLSCVSQFPLTDIFKIKLHLLKATLCPHLICFPQSNRTLAWRKNLICDKHKNLHDVRDPSLSHCEDMQCCCYHSQHGEQLERGETFLFSFVQREKDGVWVWLCTVHYVPRRLLIQFQ